MKAATATADGKSCRTVDHGTMGNEHDKDDEGCAYDIINSMYRYDRSDFVDESTEDEEPTVNGIVNMTDEVMTLRDNRGLKRYYEMPIIRKGAITGVEVKFMSDIRRHNRTTFIGTENAFSDAEAEVRLTEQLRDAEWAT